MINNRDVIVGAICFFFGVFITTNVYVKQITNYKNELQQSIEEQRTNYEKKLSEVYSDVLAKRDSLEQLNRANTDLSVRLQSLQSRTDTKTDTTESIRGELSKCRSLLSESARLLDEGCSSFGKCALDKDALAKLQ